MAKVLIYGQGISGRGAIVLLKRLHNEICVYCDGYCMVDDEVENRSNYQSVDDILAGVDNIVISPGVPYNAKLLNEARKRQIPIMSELELGAKHCKADIIAVTGTNGKTTTVELINALFQNSGITSHKIGNIGQSFAASALDIAEHDVAVAEASSFQLESCLEFAPKVGICLNITHDHLERHQTMDNYIAAKANMFSAQRPTDYAILNFDDENTRSLAETLPSKVYYYSTKSIVKGSYVCGGNIYFKDVTNTLVCSVSDIKMNGEHNIENALAMITLAKILNYPNAVIERTLQNFVPPRHRVEYVGSVGGTKYYNDSKATNINSTLTACKSMIGKTALIVGGYDKGMSYKPLFDALPLKIATVICCGANKDKIIQEGLQSSTVLMISAQNLAHAVELSSYLQVKNVLLSPATSSYDAFKNFEDRGDYFVKLVRDKLCEE